MWLESDAIVGSQSSPPQYPSRRTLTAAWLTAGAAMAQAVATAAMIVTNLRETLRGAHDFRDVLAITVIPLSSHRNDNCGERSAKYQRGQPFQGRGGRAFPWTAPRMTLDALQSKSGPDCVVCGKPIRPKWWRTARRGGDRSCRAIGPA